MLLIVGGFDFCFVLQSCGVVSFGLSGLTTKGGFVFGGLFSQV